MPADLSRRIKAEAAALGFAAVGITDARPLAEGAALRNWLASGFHAGMRWMGNAAVREDPAALLPGARSVVVTGWNACSSADRRGPGEGRVARYAAVPEYHQLIRGKLAKLLECVRATASCRGRVVVDAEPVLERALAVRAGLGWPGKSSFLVSSAHGPWLLLGELILDVELVPDAPARGRCGTCERCVAACPTGAIVSPGVVDAGRCVAYLTIEHRGAIPAALRAAVGSRLFGCDACAEACPWSRFGQPRSEAGQRISTAMPAADFLRHTRASFAAAFGETALQRAGRVRMARNAAVVLGNLGDPSAEPPLVEALRDPEPVVRGHAAWALGRLGVFAPLRGAFAAEGDAGVREEMAAAADMEHGGA